MDLVCFDDLCTGRTNRLNIEQYDDDLSTIETRTSLARRLLSLGKGGELDFGSRQFAILLNDIDGNSISYLRDVFSTSPSSILVFCLGDCADRDCFPIFRQNLNLSRVENGNRAKDMLRVSMRSSYPWYDGGQQHDQSSYSFHHVVQHLSSVNAGVLERADQALHLEENDQFVPALPASLDSLGYISPFPLVPRS